MPECATFRQVMDWIAKAEWDEALHPRDAMGRFITTGENIANGERAMEHVLRHKTDFPKAMHRPGVGHVTFRYGDSKSGVRHIIERHGAETARRMPAVIARGEVTADTRRAGTRARINIEHEGYRAVLSPHFGGDPGHWLLTGFEKNSEIGKMAPGASAHPHMNRTGLRNAGLSSLPALGAGATANITHSGAAMKAASFEAVFKDLTANSVHVTTALGNERPKKAKLFREVATAYVQDRGKPKVAVKVEKADQSLGLVFGWAIICKEDGKDYYDLNVDRAGDHEGQLVPEHITEEAMLKAALGFAEGERAGNELHEGPDVGQYPFVFPMTTDIAKAMGLETKKTGLLVAYRPPKNVFAKFLDGTYRGFSIEGRRLSWEHRE